MKTSDMHSLGLIQNDLNPSNIMMDGERSVIFDFDLCKEMGEKLGLKRGTLGWELEGAICAMPENDYFSLSKIRELLMEGGLEGRSNEY